MKIVFLGLTVTSSWGNGHATTYRALLKALARRGHDISFVEKDVDWYRHNRDLPEPKFCKLLLYQSWDEARPAVLREAACADVVVIGSYFPDAIAATNELLQDGRAPVMFYDIDTPITLKALRQNGHVDYLDAALIPGYAAYMSFTGGPTLREIEQEFGSPFAAPLYCSVDPMLYHRVPAKAEFACDMSYLGTYSADRQPKLMRMLNQAAEMLPGRKFLVAGSMYPTDSSWPANVKYLQHVAPQNHAAFYSSAHVTLNLTREDMVAAGYSPSVRLFEASGCGAAILSDPWPGIENFFTPGEEILLADTAEEVIAVLTGFTMRELRRIGEAARDRTLQQHTADHRAIEFECIVETSLCHSTAQILAPAIIRPALPRQQTTP
jgi:spore maturation protein CgeB